MSFLRCKGHRRYKAVRRPICGCFACWFKFTFLRGTPKRGQKVIVLDRTRNEPVGKF